MNEYDVVSDSVIEGKSMAEIRVIIDERVYEAWQRRWDASVVGRVTYEFIRDVEYACKKEWFEPSLRVGYILTGHGTLNTWLYERGLAESPACLCGALREDWMHVLCDCDMYESFREMYEMGVNESEDGSVDVSGVLSERERYERLCAFIERAYRMRESVASRMNAEITE